MILFGSLFFQFVSSLVRDNVLSTFEFNTVWFVSFSTWSFWSMDFMDWDSYFVFNPKNLRLKFMLGVYDGIDGIVSNLNFETRCLKSAASLIQWWVQAVLFFFLDFFWRSGMLEYWIRSCVWGHWFGCSPPGTPLNSPWKLASSVLSWSMTLPI